MKEKVYVPKITERDELIGSRLNYHGPMSSKMLRNYDGDPSLRGFEMRLNKLAKGGYIYDPIKEIRPGERWVVAPFKPSSKDPYVYSNTPLMDEYLIKRGIAIRTSPSLPRNRLHHERFLAAVTSSIELTALQKNWRYLFEFQLISKAPTFSREVPCHITFTSNVREKHAQKAVTQESHKSLLPDAYFGIYRDRMTVYFLEVDCGSEASWKTDLNAKAWRATLLKYIHLMDNGLYKKHFGLPDTTPALCLFVFNKPDYMQRAMDELDYITEGKGRPYMLFQLWNEFRTDTFIPKEPNKWLIEGAWYRVGHDKAGNPHAPITLL